MKDLDKSLANIAENVDSVALPYLKELEGSTKQRIHNFGKDSDNNTIGSKSTRGGRYSPGYERKKGKIVGGDLYPINLQMKGDLMKSFTVGLELGKPVLKFQDELNAKKAGYAEKNYKTEIYKPSEDQLEDAVEVLIDGIKEFLQDSFGV